MEHVVFFTAPDGAPAFRRLPALEDAVRFVEHLRNVEGVQDADVHPLGDRVPLAFRAWYRVELPEAAASSAPAEPVALEPHPAEPVAVPAVEPTGEASAPEPVAEPVAELAEEAPEAPAEPPLEALEPVAGLEPPVAVPAQAEPVPVAADVVPNGRGDVKSLGFFA